MKEIRASHQPVSKGEIEEHARKYEDIIRQKRDELKHKRGVLQDSVQSQERVIQQQQQHQSSERIKNYKSKFYMDQVEEDRQQKE